MKLKFVVFILFICTSSELVMSQCLMLPDSTINGIFRLQVYDKGNNLSVEQFAHMPAEQITLIDNLQWPQKYQLYTEDFDRVSLFINVDSTELLVASQGHGLMRNQYEAFLIIPIEEDIYPLLSHSGCIHTKYSHFMLDCGLGLNAPQSEVLRIKGNKYSHQLNGNWKYSYMSESYKDELKILNISYGPDEGGDVSQVFAFDNKRICCILWLFDI